MAEKIIETTMAMHNGASLAAYRDSRVQEITQTLQRLPTPMLDAIGTFVQQVEACVIAAANPHDRPSVPDPDEQRERSELWGDSPHG